jgi:predicted methyltransferase
MRAKSKQKVNDTLFKNLLKKLLVDKEYYNINEFSHPNLKITVSNILNFVSKKDLTRYS